MVEEKRQVDEKKRIGSSYIQTFYEEVVALTDFFSQYKLAVVETGLSSEADSISDEQKEFVKGLIRNIHYVMTKTMIHYDALLKVLHKTDTANIHSTYKEVEKNFSINTDQMAELVGLLNTFLADNVIQELLMTSQNIVAALYDEPTTTTS